MQSDRKRILCVDDDIDTCELTQFILGKDYELTFANSVADGLHLASIERFDLYIIDERLPDGSGADLTRQIRTFDAKKPLIFHTASAYDDDIRRGMEAGAQAYIIKPSIPSELIETVKALIVTSEVNQLQRETKLLGRTLRQATKLFPSVKAFLSLKVQK
jgi:DNA-binding response OmpR family regulator